MALQTQPSDRKRPIITNAAFDCRIYFNYNIILVCRSFGNHHRGWYDIIQWLSKIWYRQLVKQLATITIFDVLVRLWYSYCSLLTVIR
jgi:hypothetical protein